MAREKSQAEKPREILHLKWDAASIEASLDEMFRQSVAVAQDHKAWYWKRAASQKKWAQFLRAFAIIVTAIGGILPVVFEIMKNRGSGPDLSPGLASVVIALGVTALALDRFFGFSTAWIRFVTTATSLDGWIREFCYEWEHLRAGWKGQPPTYEQAQGAILKCEAFVAKVSNAVQEETRKWTEEFKAALAALDQSLKEHAASSEPGAILVDVTNGGECKHGWTLTVDRLAPETHHGKSGVASNVYSGLHQVAVVGTIHDGPAHAEAAVRVNAGETASVTVTLA